MIPTEPIGSVPRPPELIDAVRAGVTGAALDALYQQSLRDTIAAFEATGSPVIADGEQTKPSFVGYPLVGVALAPDGAVIPFADGHTRQLPRLTAGPFRYGVRADQYLRAAQALTTRPVKQAVIAASALSLVYPGEPLADYGRDQFVDDLVAEAQAELRACLDAGAATVQIDFTEGRLALKLDPTGGLLRSFIDLNNRVLSAFSREDRRRLGVHTCPGGDQDSTHSADVDYALLLPDLFQLEVDNFYVQLASEADRPRVLAILGAHARDSRRIFVGVTDPCAATVETAEQVRDRVVEAARFIAPAHLGTTDDCGFSPFGDDVSTARDLAFAKIRARVEGTALAASML